MLFELSQPFFFLPTSFKQSINFSLSFQTKPEKEKNLEFYLFSSLLLLKFQTNPLNPDNRKGYEISFSRSDFPGKLENPSARERERKRRERGFLPLWGRGGNEFVAGQCEEDTASEIRRGREGDFVDMLEGYMYTSRKSR